jgi:hypothetical protein
MERRPTKVDMSETAILDRLVEPDDGNLPPEAARALLALDFGKVDKVRMRRLSAKAREGTLSKEEREAINSYERIGHFLNILQSLARRALKARQGLNGNSR